MPTSSLEEMLTSAPGAGKFLLLFFFQKNKIHIYLYFIFIFLQEAVCPAMMKRLLHTMLSEFCVQW